MVIILKRKLYITTILCGIFAVVLFPQAAVSGGIRGVELCFKNIIPSMLPFMVLSNMLVNSGIFLPPILNGLFCGFPTGALSAKTMLDSGKITKKEMQIMACYSNNPSIAFIIGTVGLGVYGSTKLGWLLVASQVTSALLIKMLCGCKTHCNTNNSHISAVRNNSLKETAIVLATICTTVTFFSSIISVMNVLKIPPVVTSLLEITNGTNLCPPPAYSAFMLGFGGISVAFQTFAVCGNALKKKEYFILKILQASLAALLVFAVNAVVD